MIVTGGRDNGFIVFGACTVLDVHGSILVSYPPAEGAGPLAYGGHPSYFVSLLGRDDATAGVFSLPDCSGVSPVTIRQHAGTTPPEGIPWGLGVRVVE